MAEVYAKTRTYLSGCYCQRGNERFCPRHDEASVSIYLAQITGERAHDDRGWTVWRLQPGPEWGPPSFPERRVPNGR